MIFRKGMRCSDGQSLAAQRMFGVCSNDIINQAYTKLGEEDFAQEQDGGATETEEDNSKEMVDTAEVLCDTLGNIGKTCMKELQACFRREDVVRTTTNHLESMKTYLVGIARNGTVAPDALDSCDAAADIDFGPEEEEGDGEEDYMYYEEIEEVSSVDKEEIKAVIQKTLSEEKREQQQDEPKKPPPPKKLVVKNSPKSWGERNTGSVALLSAVILLLQHISG